MNQNTSKRDELLDDLLKWMKSVGAKLPSQPNRAYDPKAASAGKKGGSQQRMDNAQPSDTDQ